MTGRAATLFLLGALAVAAAPAQDPAERREKVRTILRTQDLRSTRTAFLRRYLYDPDTLVRTRAALACGSLQDTTLLPELLETLTGAPPEAQEAAAFAIGQTGGNLSPAGIEELAHELIWVRLDRTAARERLIPEIGKFGTATALSELLLRLGTGSPDDAGPLTMAVARFAIRGVKNEEATRYVLNRALDARTPDWTAAYALQRIGDEPLVRAEIPRLAGLVRHRDPLVRMHAAALFGKLGRDPALAEPLARLAEFDADWRVRVSALRALGAQAPAGIVAEAFATALRAEESAVVLTSLAALGGYADSSDRAAEGIRSLVPAIAALARGEDRAHRWQYRSAAAMTLAVLEGERAVPEIRPADAGDRLLKGGLLAALGATGSPAAEEPIAAHLADGDPHVRRTALEAHTALARSLRSDAALVRRAYDANVAALGSGDMAVITTAASHLADTLFPGPPSVAPLIAALERLRSPADIEAIQEVCRTLGKLGDRSAVGPLERLLEAGDPPAALAAAAALTAITGSDHRGRLRPDREPLHVDFDFERLEALPDTLRMTLETERGEIVMEWYPGAAPFTILSLLRLAENEGFYRGLIFHRVVPNFVIQGGDPRGDGWGGPGYAIRSEFSPATYGTGSVGIASAGKDTEGSQFFITHSPQPHLDGRYTWIGRVTAGMEVVDAIQVGDRILDLRRSR